ncbi:MAG: YajQ family cyclic di-GMP-binding protein [Gammaproteobacteria bacterium]|nr:YajQ family cyclic di-GMP-binding protein [Gammaproteobacteria bacterium]
MPSFDIVSELNWHEVDNAVDQATRELATRYDFKGCNVSFSYDQKNKQVKVVAESEYQVDQMVDILRLKFIKRGIDPKCLDLGEHQPSGKEMHLVVKLKEGIEQDLAKKIVKLLKDNKMKAQAQINGDKLRVTDKKRDELQAAMAFLRAQELDMPIQFDNFRD